VPGSGPALSHKAGSTISKNGDDNVLLHPFYPAESDVHVYQHPAARPPHDPALEEVHVDLELTDLVFASSSSSCSSDDDDDGMWSGGSSVSLGSVVSKRRRRSREGERLLDLEDTSRATASDVDTNLTSYSAGVAHASRCQHISVFESGCASLSTPR